MMTRRGYDGIPCTCVEACPQGMHNSTVCESDPPCDACGTVWVDWIESDEDA